jgi:hypothetical protein
VDGAGLSVALDLDAEHPVKFAEVRDFDMLAHTVLESVQGARVAGGDGAVVYMDCHHCDFTSLLV